MLFLFLLEERTFRTDVAGVSAFKTVVYIAIVSSDLVSDHVVVTSSNVGKGQSFISDASNYLYGHVWLFVGKHEGLSTDDTIGVVVHGLGVIILEIR